jgi:DHA1 family inner membrane transport protein
MPRRSPAGAIVLLGLGAGYGGGNVGPAATGIARSFHVSLSTVGLTMTVFFAAIAGVTLTSATVLRRLGPRPVLASCCLLAAVGNAACAVSPSFGVLLLGRGLAGLGAGLAFVIGPVLARAYSGARLVGLFGAAVTLGIAIALALGGGLVDAGAGWRSGFWISSVVGASALAVLPSSLPAPKGSARTPPGLIRKVLTTTEVWRLMLLFIHSNGITIVISTWMIPYLVRNDHDRPWVAGALGFALFSVTAAMRQVGGRLVDRDARIQRGIAISPLLAAAGIAGLALARSVAPSLLWVLLMGTGFALPYAWMIDRAQRLFPEAPAAVMAVLQTGPNVAPMAIIPLVGAALDAGHGEAAFLALAGFVAVAALVNAGRR